MAAWLPAAGAADGSQASLQNFRCQRAADPSDRLIGVTAVMQSMPGTVRMQLRFQLLERQPHSGRFRQVHGGDLGRWRHPDPPTLGQQPGDTWMVDKPVSNLAGPAVYRFRVSFRWIGQNRQVIGLENLISPSCREPRSAPGRG